MWRPERSQPNHSIRNRLIAAGAALGGLGVTAIGLRELARRGHFGERVQTALGGAAVGENAAIDTAATGEPQTATAANMGVVPGTGDVAVETRFAEPGPSERPAP